MRLVATSGTLFAPTIYRLVTELCALVAYLIVLILLRVVSIAQLDGEAAIFDKTEAHCSCEACARKGGPRQLYSGKGAIVFQLAGGLGACLAGEVSTVVCVYRVAGVSGE